MKHFCFLCICLLISASCLSAQTGYTITDLGTLGGSGSIGMAVNASGQVTGSAQTVDGYSHAFLYSAGSMKDLGTLGTGNDGYGVSINASGQVAGWALFAQDATSTTYHGFLYSNGTMTDLGLENGAAESINDSGQITGYNMIPLAPSVAFLYSGGSITSLGSLGGQSSVGYGINNSGQVTGVAETASHLNNIFLYSAGNMQDVGHQGVGSAINDSGEITGELTGGGLAHAFLYSAGVMTDLGTLGGLISSGRSINKAGQIVGESSSSSSNKYAFHAFLYTATSGMIDLNSLLPSGSGWTLTDARGINDAGQITGIGTNAAGQSHAYLLSPPLGQQLTNLVNALNVPVSVKSALLSYIPNFTTTISSLSPQQKSAFKAQLQTFVLTLQGLGLPSAQTTPLINVANALIAAL